MSFNVNVSGSWFPLKTGHVKVGGSWQTVKKAYVKAGGTWREVWSMTRAYTNLLGTVGDCESTSTIGFTWSSAGVSVTSDRVGGSYAVSTTASSSTAIFQINAPSMTGGKYYFLSMYVKNPSNNVDIQASYSQYPTNWIAMVSYGPNAGWTRIGVKFNTVGLGTLTYPRVGYNLPAGTNALMDNVMLMEITAEEYNNYSEQALMTIFPYKNS